MNEFNEQEYNELIKKISHQFRVNANFEFMLFIIGVNERGKGFQAYSKAEKTDLIRLAQHVLYSHMGMSKITGTDAEGWPTYELTESGNQLPSNTEPLLKAAMVEYFKNQ